MRGININFLENCPSRMMGKSKVVLKTKLSLNITYISFQKVIAT
jgi:hypothetical protein